MEHELKIAPCYFEAVISGDKTFEIRDNSDRGFQNGDTVYLREYDSRYLADVAAYTGRSCNAKITYVTNYEQKPNFVVFSMEVYSINE